MIADPVGPDGGKACLSESEASDNRTYDLRAIRGLALCKTRACLPCRPGHHPGHPTAVGGLPASKPGLCAGTHDLVARYPMRDGPLNRPWSGTPAGGPREFGQRGAPGPRRLSAVEHSLYEKGQTVIGVVCASAIQGDASAGPVAHLPAHDS